MDAAIAEEAIQSRRLLSTAVAFLNCANGTLLPLTVLELSATMLSRIKGKNFPTGRVDGLFNGW